MMLQTTADYRYIEATIEGAYNVYCKYHHKLPRSWIVTRKSSSESAYMLVPRNRLNHTLAAPPVDSSIDASEQDLDDEVGSQASTQVRRRVHNVADAIVLAQPIV